MRKKHKKNQKIYVIPLWIGASPTVAPKLCNTGPAELRVTDTGFFGTGIYLTPQAKYAREYAIGAHSNLAPIPPTENGEHTLLLCWVAVSTVYPITRKHDYTKNPEWCDYYAEGTGVPLRSRYDAHFVCVDPQGGYQAAMNPSDECFDELVVKEDSQVLPKYVVYFKDYQ